MSLIESVEYPLGNSKWFLPLVFCLFLAYLQCAVCNGTGRIASVRAQYLLYTDRKEGVRSSSPSLASSSSLSQSVVKKDAIVETKEKSPAMEQPTPIFVKDRNATDKQTGEEKSRPDEVAARPTPEAKTQSSETESAESKSKEQEFSGTAATASGKSSENKVSPILSEKPVSNAGGQFESPIEIWNQISAIADKQTPVKSGGIFLYKQQTAMLGKLVKAVAEFGSKENERRQKIISIASGSRRPENENSSIENTLPTFRVCETGYGAGHSAALWLTQLKDVKNMNFILTLFDYFDVEDAPYDSKTKRYKMETIDYLKQKFGRNIVVTHRQLTSTDTEQLSEETRNQKEGPKELSEKKEELSYRNSSEEASSEEDSSSLSKDQKLDFKSEETKEEEEAHTPSTESLRELGRRANEKSSETWGGPTSEKKTEPSEEAKPKPNEVLTEEAKQGSQSAPTEEAKPDPSHEGSTPSSEAPKSGPSGEEKSHADKLGIMKLHIVKGDICSTIRNFRYKCDFLHGSSFCPLDEIYLVQKAHIPTNNLSSFGKSRLDLFRRGTPQAQLERGGEMIPRRTSLSSGNGFSNVPSGWSSAIGKSASSASNGNVVTSRWAGATIPNAGEIPNKTALDNSDSIPVQDLSKLRSTMVGSTEQVSRDSIVDSAFAQRALPFGHPLKKNSSATPVSHYKPMQRSEIYRSVAPSSFREKTALRPSLTSTVRGNKHILPRNSGGHRRVLTKDVVSDAAVERRILTEEEVALKARADMVASIKARSERESANKKRSAVKERFSSRGMPFRMGERGTPDRHGPPEVVSAETHGSENLRKQYLSAKQHRLDSLSQTRFEVANRAQRKDKLERDTMAIRVNQYGPNHVIAKPLSNSVPHTMSTVVQQNTDSKLDSVTTSESGSTNALSYIARSALPNNGLANLPNTLFPYGSSSGLPDDCPVILSATVMNSLTGNDIYLTVPDSSSSDNGGQFYQLLKQKRIDSLRCFEGRKFQLEQSYVFAAQGQNVYQFFCLALTIVPGHISGSQAGSPVRNDGVGETNDAGGDAVSVIDHRIGGPAGDVRRAEAGGHHETQSAHLRGGGAPNGGAVNAEIFDQPNRALNSSIRMLNEYEASPDENDQNDASKYLGKMRSPESSSRPRSEGSCSTRMKTLYNAILDESLKEMPNDIREFPKDELQKMMSGSEV